MNLKLRNPLRKGNYADFAEYAVFSVFMTKENKFLSLMLINEISWKKLFFIHKILPWQRVVFHLERLLQTQ